MVSECTIKNAFTRGLNAELWHGSATSPLHGAKSPRAWLVAGRITVESPKVVGDVDGRRRKPIQTAQCLERATVSGSVILYGPALLYSEYVLAVGFSIDFLSQMLIDIGRFIAGKCPVIRERN